MLHCTWSWYMVNQHVFYCSRAEVELMILVKPRKRKSGNKVFSSLKAPQKHCTDLKIKTSTSSKRTMTSVVWKYFGLLLNTFYLQWYVYTEEDSKCVQITNHSDRMTRMLRPLRFLNIIFSFVKVLHSPFLLRPEYCPYTTWYPPLRENNSFPLPLLPVLTKFIVLFFKCHIHSNLFEGRLEKPIKKILISKYLEFQIEQLVFDQRSWRPIPSAWDLEIIFSKLMYLLTS